MEVYLSAEGARDYIQELAATLKESMRQTDEAIAMAKQRTAENDRLRALLREVEQQSRESTRQGQGVCIICHRYLIGYWPTGHAHNCRLHAALEGRDG